MITLCRVITKHNTFHMLLIQGYSKVKYWNVCIHICWLAWPHVTCSVVSSHILLYAQYKGCNNLSNPQFSSDLFFFFFLEGKIKKNWEEYFLALLNYQHFVNKDWSCVFCQRHYCHHPVMTEWKQEDNKIGEKFTNHTSSPTLNWIMLGCMCHSDNCKMKNEICYIY